MASKADTWMPLYIADYLRKTMHLTRDQHGGYMLLLMACWDRGGRLPNDQRQLAGIARATAAEWKRLGPVLLPFFSEYGDFLVQSRVIEEHEKAARLSEARRAAGMQGGRPKKPAAESNTESTRKPNAFANQKQNETHAGVALPSPSPPVEPIGSDTGRSETSVSSLSAAKPARARSSKRSSETSLPEGYPDAPAQAEAEAWVAEAGVTLDVGAQVRRFQNNAATKDRRERNWPAAWRQWIGISCETAPSAAKVGTPSAAEPWPGPPEVWQAVVDAKSEGFARSYLLDSGWLDLPRPTIVSPSATAIAKLRPVVDPMGIAVQERAA